MPDYEMQRRHFVLEYSGKRHCCNCLVPCGVLGPCHNFFADRITKTSIMHSIQDVEIIEHLSDKEEYKIVS